MCWPKKKKPLLEKYRTCFECKKVFNVDYSNYIKMKKNNQCIYYCKNNCYIKYIDSFFDIEI